MLPLYEKWGVKGVKFGFVNVGSQHWTRWLHEAIRKAARHNRLMLDIHDEFRKHRLPADLSQLMTVEGIGGNESSPPDAQRHPAFHAVSHRPGRLHVLLVQRQAAADARPPVGHFDDLFSPWQFLYWYDRPSACKGKGVDYWKNCPPPGTKPARSRPRSANRLRRAAQRQDWYLGTIHPGGGTPANTARIPRPGKQYTATVTPTGTPTSPVQGGANRDENGGSSDGPGCGHAGQRGPGGPDRAGERSGSIQVKDRPACCPTQTAVPQIPMATPTTPKRTSDALVLLDGLTGRSPEMAELIEQERANLDLARKVYELRTKAGLSQAELAKRVGTTQSVISPTAETPITRGIPWRCCAALPPPWKSGLSFDSWPGTSCATPDTTAKGFHPVVARIDNGAGEHVDTPLKWLPTQPFPPSLVWHTAEPGSNRQPRRRACPVASAQSDANPPRRHRTQPRRTQGLPRDWVL